MKAKAIPLIFAILAMVVVLLPLTGCPPDSNEFVKMITKAGSSSGCQGCEAVEGEGELPPEGEVLPEGEGELPPEGEVLPEGEGELPTEGEVEPGEEETILLPGNVLLTMVKITGSTYQMGRYAGEQESYSDEDPQHAVTVPGFWMGKYEITQAQWLAVMGSWPGTAPSSSYGVGDTYPAYYVSWDDAQNFITALNTHIVSSGQGPLTVRLPSEAEWEYACRAGTATRFYWGDDGDYTQIENYAWYVGNNSPYGTKTVGGKLPNAFGLYDMSGNVWEWCQDWYHSSYSGAPADGSAWESLTGSIRVFRGGDWDYYAGNCRSAYRLGDSPGFRINYLGFRLAAWPAVR